MTGRGRRTGLALLFLLGVVAALGWLGGSRSRGPSYYAREQEGLRAGLLYLRERGYPVTVWERPVGELPAEDGALLLALPLERPFTPSGIDALSRWCGSGGSVLLMMSGSQPSFRETPLFTALDLYPAATASGEPLGYRAWRRWITEGEPLEAAPGSVLDAGESAVRRARASWRLVPPRRAEVALVDEEGEPALFSYGWRGGRVVVLNDASVLSNGWLSRGGNLRLLDQLARTLLEPSPGARGAGKRTLFVDEWHHGHAVAATDLPGGPRDAVTPVLLYLLLTMGLALWSLSRPLGPPWIPRPRARAGSESARLMALARLHRQSGHVREAGAVMLDSARRGRRLRGRPEGLDLPRHFAGTERELMQLGRDLAQLQREGRL